MTDAEHLEGLRTVIGMALVGAAAGGRPDGR